MRRSRLLNLRVCLTVSMVAVVISGLFFVGGCSKRQRFLPYTEPIPIPKFSLYDYGTEEIVDYEKYGEFKNVGTAEYKYEIKDMKGLMKAVGEGIYPNSSSFRWDPKYQEYKRQGLLRGSHWDFLYSSDPLAGFFKWCTAPEPAGVRQFYIAFILERAGLIAHAIKAYYAILVHFPRSYGWTYWHTPWYIGPTSLYRIKFLLRRYPELKMKLEGASIVVENGMDNNILNDKFLVNPGKLIKVDSEDSVLPKKVDLRKEKVVKQRGGEKTKLIKYGNGHWQLVVDGQPYIIKGITYSPTKVGQSPDNGTLRNWMLYDYNKNGLIDGPYDAWIDWNKNNKQDIDEIAVGDFAIMKEMGVNTLRIYHHPEKVNKRLLRDLYRRFGIRVVMGDFLGMYTIGSGAKWEEGTDYSNPVHRKNMMESVKKMVEEFKDEPYVIFWLLGNENNYGVANNAKKDPDTYYKFVNEVAKMIKKIDPTRPVAICNGDLLYFDKFVKYCPDVDIYGVNAYRGNGGFGDIWEVVHRLAPDKVVMITEYGCPAYAKGMSSEEAEESQALYYLGCWEDILYNSAGYNGFGNAIGGFAFEYLDEWWKGYEPFVHNRESRWPGPFTDGFMYEEWLGIFGQGDGKNSPFLRRPRKVFFYLRRAWREDF